MDLFKLPKPDFDKVSKDKSEIFDELFSNRLLIPTIKVIDDENYYYWDKLKHKTPADLEPEEFWMMVKFIRKSSAIKTVIKDDSGNFFTWVKLPRLEEVFHNIDLNTGGNLFTNKDDLSEEEKLKFIARGVMEESIASSQLEGAHTTRKIAKQFLREGRKPANNSERMILNNYQTMLAIENEYKDRKLDLAMLFELHNMLTKGTIPEKEEGRFRKDEEEIVVQDKITDVIYHVPPKIDFVEKEIADLIKFANDETDELFVHPIIKAIMLHFWIGYLHPFTDGNGRIARLLFYWYLLRHGYWAFAYLPISKIIKRSPAQYGRAYVYSEQDDLDLTYFIDYNVRKIELAIKDFESFLIKQSKTNKKAYIILKKEYGFNNRQINLLQFFWKKPEDRTSIKVHMNINNIARLTSYHDLKDLEKKGFLYKIKEGRDVFYYATGKIKELQF